MRSLITLLQATIQENLIDTEQLGRFFAVVVELGLSGVGLYAMTQKQLVKNYF